MSEKKYKIPKETADKLKKCVYKKADAYNYIQRDRVDNSMFMDNLVHDPEIGDIIKNYIPSDSVKTYIKDAILNRYSKDITRRTVDKYEDKSVIMHVYRTDAVKMDKKRDIAVYQHHKEVFIIAVGTWMKWETALRKALEYVAAMPKKCEEYKVRMCLKIADSQNSMTQSDEDCLRKTLKTISVDCFICR